MDIVTSADKIPILFILETEQIDSWRGEKQWGRKTSSHNDEEKRRRSICDTTARRSKLHFWKSTMDKGIHNEQSLRGGNLREGRNDEVHEHSK